MFDIFSTTEEEEAGDDAADLDLNADDPGETDALGEVEFAPEDGGTDPDVASDPDPDRGSGDGPGVTELEVRIEDLEDQLDSAESSLRAVRDSQSEISDDIEEMNETVRRLMGMYDRIAAEDNPFVRGSEDGSGTGARDADGDPADTLEEIEEETAAGNSSTPDEDDPLVSLEELREDTEVGDADGNSGSAADANHRTDEGGARGAPDRASDRTGRADPTGGLHDESPTLTSIPDGYAGEVLVMEWLSVLMAGSGPSGALQAVEHYEDVGWISPALKDRLIDIIGGPSLDTAVDPTQFPREPTAENHATSHDYLRVLMHLQDI